MSAVSGMHRAAHSNTRQTPKDPGTSRSRDATVRVAMLRNVSKVWLMTCWDVKRIRAVHHVVTCIQMTLSLISMNGAEVSH